MSVWWTLRNVCTVSILCSYRFPIVVLYCHLYAKGFVMSCDTGNNVCDKEGQDLKKACVYNTSVSIRVYKKKIQR